MSRFADQIVTRNGEVFDLDLSLACCPNCGWQLSDPEFLDRLPKVGSWYATSAVQCDYCGITFHVRMEEHRNELAPQPNFPPRTSWCRRR